MIGLYRNGLVMWFLTALSALSLLVLLGLWVYAHRLIPMTEHAVTSEALTTWAMWGVVVAIPLITAVLWLLRFRASRRK